MNPGATTRPLASITSRPRNGAVEMAAIRFPVTPTLRMASRFVSGSITRPPDSTRSYCCANRNVAHRPNAASLADLVFTYGSVYPTPLFDVDSSRIALVSHHQVVISRARDG